VGRENEGRGDAKVEGIRWSEQGQGDTKITIGIGTGKVSFQITSETRGQVGPGPWLWPILDEDDGR
jgi:hypothetical protein